MPSRKSRRPLVCGESSSATRWFSSRSRWPTSLRSPPRTVENYLAAHEAELRANGYEILRGNALQELRLAIREQFGPEIDFGTKTTVLGILDFRAFLNIGMLIAESERARVLRQAILDIAIDAINRRTGGGTKYINQRDEDFIHAYFQEENYRKEFTDAFFLLINLDFRAN